MRWEPAGRPVDVDLIHDFARRRGLALPATYVALAAEHDGGCLDDLVVPFPDASRPDGTNATDFSLVSYVRGNGDGTMDHLADLFEGARPGHVPFGRDTGGWVFAFDARAPGPMPVVLFPSCWDMAGRLGPSIPVAADFEAFLACLFVEA